MLCMVVIRKFPWGYTRPGTLYKTCQNKICSIKQLVDQAFTREAWSDQASRGIRQSCKPAWRKHKVELVKYLLNVLCTKEKETVKIALVADLILKAKRERLMCRAEHDMCKRQQQTLKVQVWLFNITYTVPVNGYAVWIWLKKRTLTRKVG